MAAVVTGAPSSSEDLQRYRAQARRARVGRAILLCVSSLLLLAYILAPMAWLVSSSFQSEREIVSKPPHWIPHEQWSAWRERGADSCRHVAGQRRGAARPGRAAQAPVRHAARGLLSDRHARWLRAWRVRRVHRAGRRLPRALLPHLCGADGRPRHHHHRRHLARRAALAGAAGTARGGLQCGFCTPGIVLTMEAWLAENPAPSEAEIRHALSGNLCRCTGYHNIVVAIAEAAARLQKAKASE